MSEKQKRIINIISNLYKEDENFNYIMLKNRNENDVRKEIENTLLTNNISIKNLDLYVQITKMNNDVFIKLYE